MPRHGLKETTHAARWLCLETGNPHLHLAPQPHAGAVLCRGVQDRLQYRFGLSATCRTRLLLSLGLRRPMRCRPRALDEALCSNGGRVKALPRRTRGCMTTAAHDEVLLCRVVLSVGASVVLTGPCRWVSIQVGAPFALCSHDSSLACEMCSLASSGGGTCAKTCASQH